MWIRRTAGLSVATLVVLIALTGGQYIAEDTCDRPVRLPNTTYPLGYNLHIVTNIHREIFEFSGNVSIEVQVTTATNEIVLHAGHLEVLVFKVTHLTTGAILTDIKLTREFALNLLVLQRRCGNFKKGAQYRVEISYTAVLNDNPDGFYWLTYKDSENQPVYLAATQFEVTGARLAFPCYDEPAFKSKFTLRITHGSNYTANANMHVKGLPVRDRENNMITTTFTETPPMSTYTLAFVVSNFNSITIEKRGVRHSIFTQPHTDVTTVEHALNNSVIVLNALEDYFGMNYTLKKLDHYVLSKTQSFAMENWGLITYRENKLWDGRLDDDRKILNLILQAHELVHQWFGNLVSPKWWTYTWLNEGFSTYFSWLITHDIYAEPNMLELFDIYIADKVYQQKKSRPVAEYVERDVKRIFDYVIYKKSACIIRMFHHAFGQRNFQRAIYRFLKQFQYAVADQDQLFGLLQQAIDEYTIIRRQHWNVSAIMSTWTHNKGLPVLTVERDYEQKTITLRQRSNYNNSEELWWIPINVVCAAQPDFRRTHAQLFMPPQAEHRLSIFVRPTDWLLVSKQHTSLYHVLYDVQNLKLLAAQLQANHRLIPPSNRAAIFRDLLLQLEANVEAGREASIDFKVAFELLRYLRREEQLHPWLQAVKVLGFFERNLYGTPTHVLYQEFVRHLVKPIYVAMSQGAIRFHEALVVVACFAELPDAKPECDHYASSLRINLPVLNYKSILGLYSNEQATRPIIWSYFESNYAELCKHASFVRTFNEILEHATQCRLQQLYSLHHKIAEHCGQNVSKLLIDEHSERIGADLRVIKRFQQRHEHVLEKWLVHELRAKARTRN